MNIKTILAAFVIFLPVLSESAVAGSVETWICLTNTTTERKFIQVKDIDNHNWDGVSRPDHNFHNVYIEPGQRKCEREETNTGEIIVFTFLIPSRRYMRIAKMAYSGDLWEIDLILPLSANLNILLGDPNNPRNRSFPREGLAIHYGFDCNDGSRPHCTEFTIEDIQ